MVRNDDSFDQASQLAAFANIHTERGLRVPTVWAQKSMQCPAAQFGNRLLVFFSCSFTFLHWQWQQAIHCSKTSTGFSRKPKIIPAPLEHDFLEKLAAKRGKTPGSCSLAWQTWSQSLPGLRPRSEPVQKQALQRFHLHRNLRQVILQAFKPLIYCMFSTSTGREFDTLCAA